MINSEKTQKITETLEKTFIGSKAKSKQPSGDNKANAAHCITINPDGELSTAQLKKLVALSDETQAECTIKRSGKGLSISFC